MASDDKTGAAALFAIVDALRRVALGHAAHASTSPVAGDYRELAAACADFLGDADEAVAQRAQPTPSPFSYGFAPLTMPPSPVTSLVTGPQPTPEVPQSARDDKKRERK
jgi:hypothetical protein